MGSSLYFWHWILIDSYGHNCHHQKGIGDELKEILAFKAKRYSCIGRKARMHERKIGGRCNYVSKVDSKVKPCAIEELINGSDNRKEGFSKNLAF